MPSVYLISTGLLAVESMLNLDAHNRWFGPEGVMKGEWKDAESSKRSSRMLKLEFSVLIVVLLVSSVVGLWQWLF